MADKTTIAVEVEVKGVEQSIESVKDLKNAIKAAKDEQVKAAAAFGQGSQEYQNASKKLGELKDSMDDLNDSTQSLRGSGVESLSSSFGMLGDGFKNLDLDKIKTGFKGIGSAMSAIPLMLIVSGITMLAEKFGIFEMITDAVVQVLYAFTDAIGLTNKADEKAAAEMIENAENVQKAKEEQYNAEIKKAQAAGQSTKQLELDKLKSTEDSIAKQVQAMEDLQIKKGKLNDEEQKNYDELQVNLLKASGDREAKEIANNKEKVDKINAYNTFSANVTEDLRVAKLSEREKEIDAIRKASAAKLKELNDKEVFDFKQSGKAIEEQLRKNEETKKQINELAQIEINKINAKYGKEAAEKRKADRAAQLADDMKYMQQIEAAKLQSIKDDEQRLAIQSTLNKQRRDAEINNSNASNTVRLEALKLSEKTFRDEMQKIYDDKIARETKAEEDRLAAIGLMQDAQMKSYTEKANQKYLDDKAAKDKELADLKALEASKFDIIRNGLNNAQKLTDLYFFFKSQNAQKGSKEELELAKKAFNVNKALQLAIATNDGVEAVLKAFKSAEGSPITPFFPGFPFVQAGLAGVFAAGNIAKIASSKFDAGGSGATGGGGGAAPMPSIPAPPTIATGNNNTNQSTLFDESGQNLSKQKQPKINVTATVGVDEIASKSNRVSVLENQSTF